jgi:hypothetical protein
LGGPDISSVTEQLYDISHPHWVTSLQLSSHTLPHGCIVMMHVKDKKKNGLNFQKYSTLESFIVNILLNTFMTEGRSQLFRP